MLGRRSPQQSFFDAQSLPHRVDPESFYGRMGAVSDVLFRDEDLAEMYCADNGRPSLPPSLMAGVTLLQFYDDVSDREAVERMRYDLRWKVALKLPLDYAGFDPSSLTNFRKRLLAHDKERYAFDRFVAVGREAGFLPPTITALIDTTAVAGARSTPVTDETLLGTTGHGTGLCEAMALLQQLDQRLAPYHAIPGQQAPVGRMGACLKSPPVTVQRALARS